MPLEWCKLEHNEKGNLMDFDQIAEEQGWDETTMLGICRDYIATTDGTGEFLAEFARTIADEENGAELD